RVRGIRERNLPPGSRKVSRSEAPKRYRHSLVSDEQQPDVERDTTGSGLVAEKAKRLHILQGLRDAGVNRYPYRFDRSHTLGELRTTYGALEPGTETDARVAVAGRMMLRREQGKLIFATLADREDEIQLFVSKAVVGDDAFAAFGRFDLGDWLGAEGTGGDTHTGELRHHGGTVHV